MSSFNHLFQDLIVTCLYKAPASRLSCVRSMTARKALPTITDKHWVMASTYRENRGVLITCTTIFMLPSIFPTASVSLQVQVLTSRAQWLLLCLDAPSPAHQNRTMVMVIPLPNRLQDTFVTCLTSVGIRDARVCLQVDSVAENWFAFLVLSTCKALLEEECVCGLCSWSPAMLSPLLLLSPTAFQPTLAEQVDLNQGF